MSRLREALGVAALYSAVTVWWLWPLPAVMSTQAADFHPLWGPADLHLIFWALAWDAHALVTKPWDLFHANAFHPSTQSLAYSEHFLGYAPIFAPVYWLTGNAVLGANLIIVTSYPLAGLAMYALARRFASPVASVVAGFFFAFCPWRYEVLPHLHMLGVQYLPLALLLTERWLERGRWRDGVLLALALALQVLSSFYLAYVLALAYGVYLLPALAVWQHGLDRRRLVGLAAALGSVAAVMVAVSRPYVALRRLGLIPTYGDTALLPVELDVGYAGAAAWAYLRTGGVGVVGYLLAVAALLPPWRPRRWPRLLGLALAASGILFAFGIGIPIGSHVLWTPYTLLMHVVPGFASMRLAVRFAIVAQLGLALLAALGFERLCGTRPGRVRWAACATIGLAALWSFRLAPLPLGTETTEADVPAAYRWLGEHGDGRPLLELPPAKSHEAAFRMYMSTFHWLPIIEGYSAYPPKTAEYIHMIARDLPSESGVAALADWVDVGWILVHTDQLGPDDAEAWAGELPHGLIRVHAFGGDVVFRFARFPRHFERRARLLSVTETFGGVPLLPLGSSCPGKLVLTRPARDAWAPGRLGRVHIAIQNEGDRAWPAYGVVPRHLVRLRSCLAPRDGTCVGAILPLPADVRAGRSVRMQLPVLAPRTPGRYTLWLSLDQPGDGPLERCGVRPLAVPMDVADDAVAGEAAESAGDDAHGL